MVEGASRLAPRGRRLNDRGFCKLEIGPAKCASAMRNTPSFSGCGKSGNWGTPDVWRTRSRYMNRIAAPAASGHRSLRDQWRRRYVIAVFLIFGPPVPVSLVVLMFLVPRWINAFHQEEWRRRLRSVEMPPAARSGFRRTAAYSLMRVQQYGLLAFCRLILAMVPARFHLGMLRESPDSAIETYVPWMVVLTLELLLVAWAGLQLVRGIKREVVRHTKLPTDSS